MMNTDCYFARGRTHLVCQDYALARPGFAAVSDGCSSSEDTDWGARFLARAAHMQWAEEGALWGTRIAARATHMRRAAQLPGTALDATLLTVTQGENGVEVHAWGDGVIAARLRGTQAWEYTLIEYEMNAPAYLSYIADGDRLGEYMAQTEARRTIETYLLSPDGDSELIEEREEGGEYPPDGDVFGFDPDMFDVVAVVTDGLQTFQSMEHRMPVHVRLTQAFLPLLDIHITTGRFITRPAKAFLLKQCAKQQWHHNDDLAVAALHTGEDDVSSP